MSEIEESVKDEVEEKNVEDEEFSVSQGEDEETYEPQASYESQDRYEPHDSYEPQEKKARLLDEDEESSSSQDLQPRRSARPVVEVKDDEKGVLRECLFYIQKALQRKDVNAFFAFPVNDMIAPGYSSIIPVPMDFSTMHTKIENDTYDSIMDYKNDYVLMCNNAMTYNRPETIYYKEAKILLQSGIKMMSKDKLLQMRRSLGFMSSMTMEELGINQEDNTSAVIEELNAEEEYEITVKNRDNIGRFEAFPDNMTADEILAQAQAAAQDAKDMISMKPNKTKVTKDHQTFAGKVGWLSTLSNIVKEVGQTTLKIKMEVSGRKHAKDNKASTGDVHLYCDPCDAEGDRSQAGGYCKQCEEYLCKPCIKSHRRNKASKLHEVLEGDVMPTTRPTTGGDHSTLNEICPIHRETKEPLKFYCPVHDDIGCGDCIVLTHRTCKVDYISDASKGFKDSREFKNLVASISTLEQRIKDCEYAVKETAKSNIEVKQTALDSIRTFRAEILAYLDKREQELITEMEKMKAEDDRLLANIGTQREVWKKKLEEIKREIETNQEEAKKLFISAKQRKSELENLKAVSANSTKEAKSRRRHYKFNRDMAIEDIMTSKRPLGQLGSSTMSATLDIVKARCIPCNDINIRTKEDTGNCGITGIGLLTPDVLVLADCANVVVKVVDTTSKKVISRLQLSSKPWDLTILPDKQIAVTMCTAQKIQILAVHNNKLSTLRDFEVSGDCSGIDYKLGKLAVLYWNPDKVEIMDINGVVTRVINSNKTNKIRGGNSYVMFTSNGQEVLVTCSDNRMRKLSLQGDVLVTYSDTDLGYPLGIAVTGAGGVVICGLRSYTVHVVCENDKKIKTLLSQQDGLQYPMSLCVSEETGMLYVGCSVKDVLKTFKLQQ